MIPTDAPHVAVIGGGIAGLASAYYLQPQCRVTLFERAPRLGGHVHAIAVPDGAGGSLMVETGFLAFHRSHYPRLVALLTTFGIETAPSGVGLGIWDEGSGWCFDQADWFSLFGDRLPIAGRRHFADLIARMARHARRPESDAVPNLPLDAFLAAQGYDEGLARYVLWPSISALWGFQPADIMAMSARTVVDSLNRFFTAKDEPFERIAPSTQVWLDALVGALEAERVTGCEVRGVTRTAEGVAVETPDARRAFDAVIVATHADRALALLQDPTPDERRLLGAIPYHRTTSTVHTDMGVLPPDPAVWTDYNYRARPADGGTESFTTWHMNRLQGLSTQEPILVTVGPPDHEAPVDPRRVIATLGYDHPASPPGAVATRAELPGLNGTGPVAFCGSYFGSTGSNECAVASAWSACEAIAGQLAWVGKLPAR